MKYIFASIMAVLLSSCMTVEYYQVCKVEADEPGHIKANTILFEDDHCVVRYNFWDAGGNVGFNVFNKTENDIVLDLAKSFFVLNGISKQYYQNRTYTKSSNTSTTSQSTDFYGAYRRSVSYSGLHSDGYAVAYTEPAEIVIPSNTSVNVKEFFIQEDRFIDCGLAKTPDSRDNRKLTFDLTSSPMVFYNIISYRVSNTQFKMENRFHISEISNFPKATLMEAVYESKCGTRLEKPYEDFKQKPVSNYYIRYNGY